MIRYKVDLHLVICVNGATLQVKSDVAVTASSLTEFDR
jgi:hypothetical protein